MGRQGAVVMWSRSSQGHPELSLGRLTLQARFLPLNSLNQRRVPGPPIREAELTMIPQGELETCTFEFLLSC